MVNSSMLTNCSNMCQGNGKQNGFKDESMIVAEILEEFYDPEVSILSEEELEEIIMIYGNDIQEDNKNIIEDIIYEYYDPNTTPLTEEELEEILSMGTKLM